MRRHHRHHHCHCRVAHHHTRAFLLFVPGQDGECLHFWVDVPVFEVEVRSVKSAKHAGRTDGFLAKHRGCAWRRRGALDHTMRGQVVRYRWIWNKGGVLGWTRYLRLNGIIWDGSEKGVEIFVGLA